MRLRQSVADGRIAELCRRQGIEMLVLFGSGVSVFATQSQHDQSDQQAPQDVDLAFRQAGRSVVDLLAVAASLYQIMGIERIDLLDLCKAGPVARQRALTRGRKLYETSASLFAEAQIRAAMEYYDTAPLRQLERELLAVSR